MGLLYESVEGAVEYEVLENIMIESKEFTEIPLP
jgi:hypothetical protein